MEPVELGIVSRALELREQLRIMTIDRDSYEKLCDEASEIMARFSADNADLAKENIELKQIVKELQEKDEIIADEQGIGAPTMQSPQRKEAQKAFNKVMDQLAESQLLHRP